MRTYSAPSSEARNEGKRAGANPATEPGHDPPRHVAAIARNEPPSQLADSSRSDVVPPSLPAADAAPSGAGPKQDLAHLKLWSAAFSGGRALVRVAEAPDGASASPRTRTLAAVLRRARSHGTLAPAPDARTSVPGMRALALAGERSAALWLLAPGEGWGAPVKRARVTVCDLEPGRWRVTWLDDVSGAELASEERDVDAVAVLPVPTFARHVAAVLERADPR